MLCLKAGESQTLFYLILNCIKLNDFNSLYIKEISSKIDKIVISTIESVCKKLLAYKAS